MVVWVVIGSSLEAGLKGFMIGPFQGSGLRVLGWFGSCLSEGRDPGDSGSSVLSLSFE